MIYTLGSIIPDACNGTPRGNVYVRAMHLPFYGGLFDRISDAWQVFRQKAVAVRWPQAGELEDVFNIRNELLPEQIRPKHVVEISHKLGMHEPDPSPDACNYAHTDCQECYEKGYNAYVKECVDLLKAIDRTDQIPAFMEYINDVNDPSRPLSERWWIMHEPILYEVGTFLGYELDTSDEFKAMEGIYIKNHQLV